eukprot:2674359-Pyramimonas_sp.AAC.1
MVYRVLAPRRFPQDRPLGCERQDWQQRWQQFQEAAPRTDVPVHGMWASFIGLVEQQFLDIYQIDPRQADAHSGRGVALKLDQVRSRAPHRLPFPRLSALAV